MDVIHDRSLIDEESRNLIMRGFASENLLRLRLDFMYTEAEQVANRQLAASFTSDEYGREAKRRSDVIYEVVQIIADRFVCYQFDPTHKISYDDKQWDLFFSCNDFTRTAPATGLQGRDYSHVNLSFNDKHGHQKRLEICSDILALIGRQFPFHQNLSLAIQYSVQVDKEKVNAVVTQLIPSLFRTCTLRGIEGKIVVDGGRLVFRKKKTDGFRNWPLSREDVLHLSFLNDKKSSPSMISFQIPFSLRTHL